MVSTDSRYASSRSSNSFHEGMLITRASTSFFLSASCAFRHSETSLPVPISNTSGFPLVASESTYAPRRSPEAEASFDRSKVRQRLATQDQHYRLMFYFHDNASCFSYLVRVAWPNI